MRERARHREAFACWHAAGRNARAVQEQFHVSERSVMAWLKEFDWHRHADRLDAAAQRQADQAMVRRQSAVLTAQRQAGELLRRRGTEHLVKYPIKSTADAIRAIQVGCALERAADELPDYLIQLVGMSEAELQAEQERLSRALTPAAGEVNGLHGLARLREVVACGQGESP